MSDSQMVYLVVSLLTAFTVAFAMFFIVMFLKQNRRNERLEEQLFDLVFQSRFSGRRADMEESLINLGKEFQHNADDFSDVLHLPLRGQHLAERTSNSFLKSMGLSEDGLNIKDKQIFVLTPFSQAETETFAVIRTTLLNAGFQVFRGDETKRTDVFSHIVKSMMESRVVIANLNGRNPNVMYELGIAHMMDKSVILVAEVHDDLSSIPFDLRSKNIVLYDRLSELKERLPTAVLQLV